MLFMGKMIPKVLVYCSTKVRRVFKLHAFAKIWLTFDEGLRFSIAVNVICNVKVALSFSRASAIPFPGFRVEKNEMK